MQIRFTHSIVAVLIAMAGVAMPSAVVAQVSKPVTLVVASRRRY